MFQAQAQRQKHGSPKCCHHGSALRISPGLLLTPGWLYCRCSTAMMTRGPTTCRRTSRCALSFVCRQGVHVCLRMSRCGPKSLVAKSACLLGRGAGVRGRREGRCTRQTWLQVLVKGRRAWHVPWQRLAPPSFLSPVSFLWLLWLLPPALQSSLMGASLTLPIQHGRLALGTWQGIYLNEHRQVVPAVQHSLADIRRALTEHGAENLHIRLRGEGSPPCCACCRHSGCPWRLPSTVPGRQPVP